jgi:signal transduction histidine kinase
MSTMTARRFIIVVALAGAYILVARFGLAMDAVSGFATLVWPPTGLSLAALLLVDEDAWAGVAIGAFVTNAWAGATVPVALGIALGNTLEAVAAAWALRRFADFHPSIDRLNDALALVALAALGSTLISATIGVGSLVLGHRIDVEAAGHTWRAWWLGDTMGDLVVAPLLMTMAPVRRSLDEPPSRRRIVEALALEAATIASAVWLFGARSNQPMASFREAYMIFPLLVWAALRFGSRGAAVATFSTSAIAIAGAASGRGPFLHGRLADSLVSLQVFMAIAATTTLILGAIAQERRHALALRDSLLSVASHELRTPLSALQLRAQMLTRGMIHRDASAERLEDDALAIERHVKRLSGLVEDLLDISRIMAGRLRLQIEPVDLNVLLREVVDRLAPEERERVRLEATGASVVGQWDRSRVDQVVTNLLSNAIKYGAEAPVEVSLGCDGDRARIAIRDQGIGIAAADQERIFGRFERAQESSKNAVGFGLGLWIVKQIVDAAGGSVHVKSELGKGSIFTVELPLGAAPEAPSPGSPERLAHR